MPGRFEECVNIKNNLIGLINICTLKLRYIIMSGRCGSRLYGIKLDTNT